VNFEKGLHGVLHRLRQVRRFSEDDPGAESRVFWAGDRQVDAIHVRLIVKGCSPACEGKPTILPFRYIFSPEHASAHFPTKCGDRTSHARRKSNGLYTMPDSRWCGSGDARQSPIAMKKGLSPINDDHVPAELSPEPRPAPNEVARIAVVPGAVGRRRRRAYCAHCGEFRSFSRRGIDHSFHAILTVFTAGAWAGVWMGTAVRHWYKDRWRCSGCGHRLRTGTKVYSDLL
jgi:hypothetical protein